MVIVNGKEIGEYPTLEMAMEALDLSVVSRGLGYGKSPDVATIVGEDGVRLYELNATWSDTSVLEKIWVQKT